MPVTFDTLQIGTQYDRPYLAEAWGYESFHAIAKGAVTPRATPYIILFITREKQEFQTQYEDHLENGVLAIEGETNHAADNRMINAAESGDQIHLFYRERHHMPFTYYGQIYLSGYERHSDSPSRFMFRVPSEHPDDSLETELITHGQPNEEFIPDVEGRRIIRQHVAYERSPRNRQRALEIHKNCCKACDFKFDDVYGHQHAKGYIEIHHVKSITEINGPVNPEIDLVPLCSNCHSMAHREKGRILTVEEIKALLRKPK
jgi:5-methylcytosine-specific restriction protein A